MQQRDLGLGLALERHDVGAVFLGHRLVVPGALDAADLLVLELLPGFEIRLFVGEHVDARRVIERLDDADELPAVRLVVHGGDHQVDLALLQELHAVRRDNRLKLQFHAELVRDEARDVRLEADDRT